MREIYQVITGLEATAVFLLTARKPARDPKIELVINGDVVDFLAEREPDPPHWVPFTPDPDAAARKLAVPDLTTTVLTMRPRRW